MSWGILDRFVTAGVAFKDLSSALTCPVHCGQSAFFPFVAGLSVGILLGFLASIALCLFLLRPLAATFPSFDFGHQRSVHPRLRAYRE